MQSNLTKNYFPIYFAKSGIHIKPENRGKFTETKKRTGKTTEELTHSKNPLTRKRAIFALNAKKWKHQDGGVIYFALSGRKLPVSDTTYTVLKGDSLWKIATNNGLTLDSLLELNPQLLNNLNSVIYPGDTIIVKDSTINQKPVYNRTLNTRYDLTSDLTNLKAIQAVKHNKNYVIIDKKNHLLSVFDPNNNLIYQTDKITTGSSRNDYNTITYLKNGKIKNGAGNMSTPAGITQITSVVTYHGVPAFTRARVHNDGSVSINDKVDNIASSIHYGNYNQEGSNGCVRVPAKDLKQLSNYIKTGSMVYTLPEQNGSKFILRDGMLNFIANNPYGENSGDKRFLDDYNVTINKSYRPLEITTTDTHKNVQSYIKSLQDNKLRLMNEFSITSATYNELAQIAVGIAKLESDFGRGRRYKTKNFFGEKLISSAKKLLGNASYNSRGITLIKIEGDNNLLLNLYEKYGIDNLSIKQADKAALATMLKLIYTYLNEVVGKTFIGANNLTINPYDALLYKYNGRNSELNGKATPNSNLYINNVKNALSEFSFYSAKNGGKIKYFK